MLKIVRRVCGAGQANALWVEAYSIADIVVLLWVYRLVRHSIDLAEYPAVLRWYDGLMLRPAVIKGFSVGQD